jgi:alkylation response protein AidB-like acyl-CoA dehydrogenase
MASVLLGHMQSALDASVEYAAQRKQYGAPIGSFQAIRHLCADMLVDVDASRSATYGAAWAVSSLDDLDERERSGAVAKAHCHKGIETIVLRERACERPRRQHAPNVSPHHL